MHVIRYAVKFQQHLNANQSSLSQMTKLRWIETKV